MCIEQLHTIISEFNLPVKVCNKCYGDGEIVTFCGHDVVETCQICMGKGYIPKNLEQKSE